MKNVLLVVLMIMGAMSVNAQSFTYQGFLRDGGIPAHGVFNIEFKLFDAANSGNQVGGTITKNGVQVVNGLFTVALDFGTIAFTGLDRFLEIAVSGTPLSPRVRLSPTPYSIFSQNTRGLSVDGSGRIGIGTTAPTFPLHIAVPEPVMALQDSDSTTNQVGYVSFRNSANVETGWVGFGTPSLPHLHLMNQRAGGNLALGTAGSERLTITSAGNVGIGTPTPNFKLEVRTTGLIAVSGQTSSSVGTAMYGEVNAATGINFGVWGQSSSTSGRGVVGLANATSGTTFGVRGESGSTAGIGVLGLAYATSGSTRGGFFRSDSSSGIGVHGFVSSNSGLTIGVRGQSSSPDGVGVYGSVSHSSGVTKAVLGECPSSSGHAVYAAGRFAATGTKSFQIDHPFDPENKYLNHFCTEGPEPYNIYSGMVMLDARGEAWVLLPGYFGEINRDPRYALTAVGAAMPNLHVAEEIQDNRFKIAGGKPGKRVSWEVKAVRSDRWVQRYGFETEQDKSEGHRGKYLNPELYDRPGEKGIHHTPEPEHGQDHP